MTDQETWLRWAQRLQAIAQAGLAYSKDPYDLERFSELRKIAVDIVAEHSGASPQDIVEKFAIGSGYPTPKVDVRAVVFRNDDILLVRERALGLWSLPGGWADVGESPSEVAVRETLEETGYRVRALKLLGLLDKSKHDHPASLEYTYKIFVQCDLEGGDPQTSHETDAVGFFGSDVLPELETNRVTLRQVRRLFEHHLDPLLPTDFD